MDVIVEAHHVNREVLAGIVGVGRALVAIERGGFGPDLVDEFACCHDPISVLWFVLRIIVYNIRPYTLYVCDLHHVCRFFFRMYTVYGRSFTYPA